MGPFAQNRERRTPEADSVEPILLGGGKSIYPRSGGVRSLELISTTSTATGVLVCTYRRA